MKVIYRPHRGGLSESMQEARVFNSVEEMKEWIALSNFHMFSAGDIVIDGKSTWDNRVNWNTHYVCVNRTIIRDYLKEFGSPHCIGMCAFNEEAFEGMK